MAIKKVLNILKRLDKVDTRSLFGHYSSKYVWQQISEMNARRVGWKQKDEIIAEQMQDELNRFYSTLSKLKKQGFIKKINNDRRSFWCLTQAGLKKWLFLNSVKNKNLIPMKSASLEKEHLKVIVFDIPESRKNYRDWLRQTLINFGFRKLQKSVWIGNPKLTEDFLFKLKEYNLVNYIHIFSVKDLGTII